MRGLIWTLGLLLVGIVDRFEGAWAVVEWRVGERLVLQDVPRGWLPPDTVEGDGLHAVLPDTCAADAALQRFLRDAAACGGRVPMHRAPPWTGIVHIETARRQP